MRITPKLPAGKMKTYQLLMPVSSHFRRATCEEVGCENQQVGWETYIDESTELGKRQAAYIRQDSGRRFAESKDRTGITIFDFPAGQTCFEEHYASLEREPIHIVRGGDRRGNPTGFKQRHANAQDWVEDFAEHQQKIADAVEKG